MKRILDEAARVTVPEFVVEVEVSCPNGQTLYDRLVEEEEELRLFAVELETRYGRLVPDITCEAFRLDGHAAHLPLLIEVTVTNPV